MVESAADDVVRFFGLPETVELAEGRRLRRLSADDLPALVAAVNASLDTLRPWMPWAQEPMTVEKQGEWLDASDSMWAEGTGFNWGIVDESGTVLGGIGFHVRNGPGVLEIVYWLAADQEGKGLMTEAAGALTRVAAGVDGVTRVEIHCDVDNVRSAGVPRRLGYSLVEIRDAEPLAPAHTGRHQIWVLRV
jgi:RimJ/RimL family protein N-acetyltransferase